jgi:hypothetical protein
MEAKERCLALNYNPTTLNVNEQTMKKIGYEVTQLSMNWNTGILTLFGLTIILDNNLRDNEVVVK